MQAAAEKAAAGIDSYRFDETANAIYQFFWSEFCDWYVELVKTSLQDDAPEAGREAARSVLIHVLDASMRLLHPLCPFQSEEIWQRLPAREARWRDAGVDLCALAPYPEPDEAWQDAEAESALDELIRTVTRMRNLRVESGLPQQQRVSVVLLCDAPERRALFAQLTEEITRLAQLSSLEVHARADYTVPRQAAMNADPVVDVVIPLEGVIDLDAERERIQKDLAAAQKQYAGFEKKLGNEKYVNKAPADVVEETRTRARECQERIASLQAALERL